MSHHKKHSFTSVVLRESLKSKCQAYIKWCFIKLCKGFTQLYVKGCVILAKSEPLNVTLTLGL